MSDPAPQAPRPLDAVASPGKPAQVARPDHTAVAIPQGFKLVPDQTPSTAIPEGYKLVPDDNNDTNIDDTQRHWCLMVGGLVASFFFGALGFLGLLLFMDDRNRRKRKFYAIGAAIGTAINFILGIVAGVLIYYVPL